MIINLVGKGSYNPSENSDLNVTSKDIMKDKVSISKDGTPIIGEAPFEYLGTEDEETNRIAEEKAMVIGYARLLRRTIRRNGLNTPDGQSRIALCKRHLEELLGRIDTLAI